MVILDANVNNENRTNITLVDSEVPKVTLALRFLHLPLPFVLVNMGTDTNHSHEDSVSLE